MSELKPTTGLVGSAGVSPHSSQAAREPSAASVSHDALFVIPTRGGGLRASIRGQFLELAEPGHVHRLAPTPDDLLIASMASDLAWTARHHLRARGLPEEVTVSAAWLSLESLPRLSDVRLTVTVSKTTDASNTELEHILADRLAARSLDAPPRLHLLSR